MKKHRKTGIEDEVDEIFRTETTLRFLSNTYIYTYTATPLAPYATPGEKLSELTFLVNVPSRTVPTGPERKLQIDTALELRVGTDKSIPRSGRRTALGG